MRATILGDLANVRQARTITSRALSGLPAADTATLVVSELVANAILHSASGDAGGRVQLDVVAWQGRALVAVTDEGGPERPHVPDDQDEHGRGLELVGALADRWGFEITHGGGRRAWAWLG